MTCRFLVRLGIHNASEGYLRKEWPTAKACVQIIFRRILKLVS
jgi:hypothetical protein